MKWYQNLRLRNFPDTRAFFLVLIFHFIGKINFTKLFAGLDWIGLQEENSIFTFQELIETINCPFTD